MNLNESIINVKGVGDKTIPKFNKLNIYTIGDMILNLPRGFMDIHEPIDNPYEHIGELVAVCGRIQRGSVRVIKKGRMMTFAKVVYSEGIIDIIYFNAPYIAKQLDFLDERIFFGYLSSNRNVILTQPKIYTKDEYYEMLSRPQPVYSLTKGLSNNKIRSCIENALDIAEIPDEYLNSDELLSYKMPAFDRALRGIHFPESIDEYLASRRRLVFHEFLTYFLETQCDETYSSRPFSHGMIEVADTGRLIEALPYRLTDAQLRTWTEIEQDMCSGICMNRMIQGDVGSGKTIIAFLALLLNAANNHQGVMMVPTEVLALQHYEELVEFVEKYKLPIVPKLLIGAMSAKAKRDVYEAIKTGYANVIIGTHAVIQEAVDYRNLTLAITDEQHRFGVKQRERLAEFNDDVHILVMSATPIPRSLAMTMFSGVQMSLINELPSNRLPIKNCVVGVEKRNAAYKWIADEVAKGHQAYVICPLVEETEGMNLENVVDYSEKLREALPENVRIDYLHGKMRSGAKTKLMDEFANHNIDVLVSTTVIEVGINVPNATVMLVENADRFGLATLHQIRGRVGRGEAQSFCIFINTSKSENAAKRLDILNRSNDGFYIAEQDLKMRGPGEVQGIRQTGDFGFVMADIYDDCDILMEVREYTDYIMKKENRNRFEEILDSVEEYGFNPVDFKTI